MALAPIVVERFVAAPAQRIFDVLADPRQHPVIDGGGTVRAALDGNPDRLSAGARFGMDMKVGAPYRISNTVVEFEEARRLAWRHFNGHVWRYVLTPDASGDGGGTVVREEWDPTHARNQLVVRLLGFPRRNRAAMARTLANLAALVTAG
jgi:uncharacterized protein YndB with AHSA1/START domain